MIKLYNSRTRTKEILMPIDENHVRMYVCGPTVYDRAHLGNARPVVVFDVLYRVLKYYYTRVTYVRNITDVDDKINTAAAQMNISIETLTEKTIADYHEDAAALGALVPDIEPRATQHIDEMIAMITSLIDQEYAYESHHHVLFRVNRFERYGKLSLKSIDELIAGARVEKAPYKEDHGDFVLWKPSSSEQPGWNSPWGRGRPGWHIECSAMSAKYLGPVFDIHGGGIDLIFPHHENEVAQSCAVHQNDHMAHFWVHNGHLMVDGQKMSKSLGNFFTVQDLLNQYPGEVLRFAMLMVHYRQPLDWTQDLVQQAKATLDKFYASVRRIRTHAVYTDQIFLNALKDDMNTPLALSRLHEFVRLIHKTSGMEQKEYASQLIACGQFIGLFQQSSEEWFQSDVVDTSIQTQIDERKIAKQNQDFQRADAIRDHLSSLGIILEDTAHGTTWRKK